MCVHQATFRQHGVVDMGATTFRVKAPGDNAQKAFQDAITAAILEYGTRPYSGTIKEKESFITISQLPGMSIDETIKEVLDPESKHFKLVFDDKWGPAGCIRHEDGEWIFFGWASC